MKKFGFAIVALPTLLFFAACKKEQQPLRMCYTGETETITFCGRLYASDPNVMTTYMYGEYGISNSTTGYAVRSETIDLSTFVGEWICITGTPIEGYPVEDGPVYLEVTGVSN